MTGMFETEHMGLRLRSLQLRENSLFLLARHPHQVLEWPALEIDDKGKETGKSPIPGEQPSLSVEANQKGILQGIQQDFQSPGFALYKMR
jgi:hypothetical protein